MDESTPTSPSIRDPRTYAIIGAAMEVHRTLGPGFLEPVYQEALALEFTSCEILFEPQVALPVYYKGQLLNATYRVDFLCYRDIVLEIKALNQLGGAEEAQVINYLKATRFRIGLLVNFDEKSLTHRRFVL